MTWTLPEPMLAAAVTDPALPQGWAAEPKWDGWRALMSVDAGRLVLCSRRGTDLEPAFPELRSGAAQLPDATALDGELVVWDAAGRLAFERLQGRLQRRGAGALRLAEQWPAHFVAFDVLRVSGTDTTRWSYRRRRAALEALFADHRLTAVDAVPVDHRPRHRARVADQLDSGRSQKAGERVRAVRPRLEEIQGQGDRRRHRRRVHRLPSAPRTLLLGRYYTDGRLRYIGRSTTLPQTAGRALSGLLAPSADEHPWTGWTFSAGWGSRETLHVTLVEPELVVEVGVDVARDAGGRWRHPARRHRIRAEMHPMQVAIPTTVEGADLLGRLGRGSVLRRGPVLRRRTEIR